jgi:membrane protease YdiL (CAAX protease family)
LGAIFGYLYYWSGSLFLSVLGHFINNGLTLIFIFLFQKGLISFDLLGHEINFDTYILLIFFIFTISLLFILRKIYFMNEQGLAKSF